MEVLAAVGNANFDLPDLDQLSKAAGLEVKEVMETIKIAHSKLLMLILKRRNSKRSKN